jgi:cytochrome c oxidase subunit 4
MSTSAVEHDEGTAPDAGDHGAHPTDALYVKVALILAVVTAIEVGLYYTTFSQTATNAALIALAAIKFVMVAAYFMHLKFDNKLLRRLFITGFVLAASVYVAYLLTLGIFV